MIQPQELYRLINAHTHTCISLDLGMKNGIAILKNNTVESYILKLKTPLKKGQNRRGRIFSMFNDSIESLIKSNNPQIIIYEDVIGFFRSKHARDIQIGLKSTLLRLADNFDIKTAGYPPLTIKKTATGNHRASKDHMLEKAKELFPDEEIEDHNQADALLILATHLIKAVKLKNDDEGSRRRGWGR